MCVYGESQERLCDDNSILVFANSGHCFLKSVIIDYMLIISKGKYFPCNLLTEFWVALNGKELISDTESMNAALGCVCKSFHALWA